MSVSDLSLTATFDRDHAWSGGGSVRHLVATLAGRSPRPSGPRKPLNLALVIDASGSMGGRKLLAAKRAASGVIDRLTAADRLTLISFAEDVIVEADALSGDRAGRAIARARVAALEPRGSTNLSGGWFAGVDRAAAVAERDPAMPARVVILTDGHANVGVTAAATLALHARALNQRGVVTSTLGIGDDYDEALMQAVAEAGGGRHHDAEFAEEIESVLLGEIDEAAATAADGVVLELTLPDTVRAEVLGFRSESRGPGRVSVTVGFLADGRPLAVAVRLHCPRGTPGDSLALRLEARGRCAVSGQPLAAAATARLGFVESAENAAQPRHAAAAADVLRAWHSHLLRLAAERNRAGDFTGAEALIARELGFFAPYARDLPGGPAKTSELTLMLDQVGRRWSARTAKEAVLMAEIGKRAGVDHRGPGKPEFATRLAAERSRDAR